MTRIDLTRLRKRAGMSQRQLADLLQVRPSFISAIENGKSPLPDEKLRRIMEVFELDSLDEYLIADAPAAVAPHTHMLDQSDSLTHLLTHFHDLAHKNSHSEADGDSAERIDFLTRRNDRLSDRVDALSDEVDALRAENLHLKELLIKNGIDY